MLRTALLLAAVAAAALAATAQAKTPPPERTVPCRETIEDTEFPYTGSGSVRDRYRTVLGAVSVPPSLLAEIEPNDDPKWKWWHKAGLVVRADGRPVTISVPAGWRNKVAIEWGNAGTGGPFSTLRIAGCKDAPKTGHAYAGGFVVARPACVPVTFHVGTRSATVRFGLGKAC